MRPGSQGSLKPAASARAPHHRASGPEKSATQPRVERAMFCQRQRQGSTQHWSHHPCSRAAAVATEEGPQRAETETSKGFHREIRRKPTSDWRHGSTTLLPWEPGWISGMNTPEPPPNLTKLCWGWQWKNHRPFPFPALPEIKGTPHPVDKDSRQRAVRRPADTPSEGQTGRPPGTGLGMQTPTAEAVSYFTSLNLREGLCSIFTIFLARKFLLKVYSVPGKIRIGPCPWCS